MKNSHKLAVRTGCGGTLGCLAMFLALNIIFGGVCTEYVIEFWGSQYKGVPVDVPFFPCALVGVFLGEFTIPAAMVTWLISFFL